MDPSARPRLGDHVLARRHLVDGRERVVLHDTNEGRLIELGPREWGLLAAADGTRDLEGVLLAAARDGSHARAPALVAFLDQLHAAEMLELEPAPTQGAEAELSASSEAVVRVDADPPLETLPGFTLVCDGSGSCCRLYASVLFGPLEAARARSLMPEVLDADRHDRVFTPEKGSGPTAGAAVALTNGRCVYLGDAGRCGLHAAGGPRAKPTGCSTFPASFVDDGESVRVSVAVECACVLASIGQAGGSPLIGPSVARLSDLDATLVVTTLPARVRLTRDHDVARAAFVAWSRRVQAALEAASGAAMDAPSVLITLSEDLESTGADGDVDAAVRAAPILDVTTLAPWISALHERAATRAREDAAWRSRQDLARRATAWIEQATALLLDEPAVPLAPRIRVAEEAFYLRAILHGHQLVGARPVSIALVDRAVRLVVARALDHLLAATPAAELDSAAAHPLALVEAMLRGHGLDAYASDVAAPPRKP